MADNLRISVGKFSVTPVQRRDGDGVLRNFVQHPRGGVMEFREFGRAAAVAGFIIDTQAWLVAQVRPLNAATGNLARYGVSVARKAVR